MDAHVVFTRFPRFFGTLSDGHPFPAATQLATPRIFNPLSLVRFAPPTVSKLCTRFFVQGSKLRPVVSFASKAYSVWLDVRNGGLVSSRRDVHHCVRLCVLQKRHVLLVHKSEVVFELNTEPQPGSLSVVLPSP